MAVNNTVTYATQFDDVLQDRLDHPTTWKEVCDVRMTDTRVLSTSNMSTTPSVQTVTRGTGHSMQTYVESEQTLTISTGRDLGLFLDLADEAQSPWTKPAELFDRIGALLNEFIESSFLAQHASWTDFGTEGLTDGAGSTSITITAVNIDDVVRSVKREIRQANGQALINSNGICFVWRAADFEFLEVFTQANGFMSADEALKKGVSEGLLHLGVEHYWSNEHTAGHVFAGIKKAHMIGILKSIFGRAYTIPFPAGDTNTYLSGTSYYSRVEIGHLVPTPLLPVVFDVNVA